MLTYSFSTKTIHGMVRPLIQAAPSFDALSYLDVSSVEDTKEILTGLTSVLNESVPDFSWGSEGCIVNSLKDVSTVIYAFDMSETHVSTQEIHQFMLDWQQCLVGLGVSV